MIANQHHFMMKKGLVKSFKNYFKYSILGD